MVIVITVEPPIKDPPTCDVRKEDNLRDKDRGCVPKVSFIWRFHYISIALFTLPIPISKSTGKGSGAHGTHSNNFPSASKSENFVPVHEC